MSITKHLRISGRVQGVGFRMYMQQKADDLGVTGWVRNRRDGTVEAVLSGAPEVIEKMIEALWEGPPLAKVAAVDRFAHGEIVEPGFAVRPTA